MARLDRCRRLPSGRLSIATAESAVSIKAMDSGPGQATTSTLAPRLRAAIIAGMSDESPVTIVKTDASVTAVIRSTASATFMWVPSVSTTWKPMSRATLARPPCLEDVPFLPI